MPRSSKIEQPASKANKGGLAPSRTQSKAGASPPNSARIGYATTDSSPDQSESPIGHDSSAISTSMSASTMSTSYRTAPTKPLDNVDKGKAAPTATAPSLTTPRSTAEPGGRSGAASPRLRLDTPPRSFPLIPAAPFRSPPPFPAAPLRSPPPPVPARPTQQRYHNAIETSPNERLSAQKKTAMRIRKNFAEALNSAGSSPNESSPALQPRREELEPSLDSGNYEYPSVFGQTLREVIRGVRTSEPQFLTTGAKVHFVKESPDPFISPQTLRSKPIFAPSSPPESMPTSPSKSSPPNSGEASQPPTQITDKTILAGLNVAAAAASNEEIDIYITEATGSGVRRFLADLSPFDMGADSLVVAARKMAVTNRSELVAAFPSPPSMEMEMGTERDSNEHLARNFGLVARGEEIDGRRKREKNKERRLLLDEMERMLG